jgi:hypothetical protein
MSARNWVTTSVLLLVLCPAVSAELTPGPNDVFVRVVDCAGITAVDRLAA